MVKREKIFIKDTRAIKTKSASKKLYKNASLPMLARVVSLLLFITLVALSLIVAPYYFGKPSTYVPVNTAALTSARQQHQAEQNQIRSERIGFLQNTGGVASSSPDLSLKEDVCEITPVSRGWERTNWQQNCFIRYIDLFETSLSSEQLLSKLTASNKTTLLFGDKNTDTNKECRYLYNPSLIYLRLSVDKNEKAEVCQKHGLLATSGYENRVVDTERLYSKEDIKDASTYLVVLSGKEYYFNQNIGCGPGTSCPQPTSSVVFTK